MKCSFCGNEVEKGMKHCPLCGAEVKRRLLKTRHQRWKIMMSRITITVMDRVAVIQMADTVMDRAAVIQMADTAMDKMTVTLIAVLIMDESLVMDIVSLIMGSRRNRLVERHIFIFSISCDIVLLPATGYCKYRICK